MVIPQIVWRKLKFGPNGNCMETTYNVYITHSSDFRTFTNCFVLCGIGKNNIAIR